jgi:hypothetical protein
MTRIDLLTNPMTTAEDLIVGGASGAPTALPVGTDDDVLTVVSGAVTWQAPGAVGGLPTWISDNYQPDAYPVSPDTVDDEFEGGGALDGKWTVANSAGGADDPNQTDVAGILHTGLIELGTDNVASLVKVTQTAPAGTAVARYRAKVSLGLSGQLGGEDGEFGAIMVSLIDITNGIAVGSGIGFNNDTTTAVMRPYAQQDAAGAIGNMSTAEYTHWKTMPPGGWYYVELRKTTTAAYTSANTYEAWISTNGIAWVMHSTCSQAFTATPVLGFTYRRPKSQTGTPKIEAYADFFRKVL